MSAFRPGGLSKSSTLPSAATSLAGRIDAVRRRGSGRTRAPRSSSSSVQATSLVAGSIMSLPVACVAASVTMKSALRPTRLERIVVGAELLLEDRCGGDQVVPGLGHRQAGLFERVSLKKKTRPVVETGMPLSLPFIVPAARSRVAPLREVDRVGELGAGRRSRRRRLREQRQPRPVDLHDVGLGAAGHLGGRTSPR